MSHLPIERLAELGNSEPSAPERIHLVECAMCSAELEAYRRVVAMAADEHRRIAPPLTNWRTLGARLREEGLVTSPVLVSAAPSGARRLTRALQSIAAAAVFLLGGTIFGRYTAGLSWQDALALGEWQVADTSLAQNVALSRDEFASTAAALKTMQEAQHDYDRAASYLAAHDSAGAEANPELYRTRLAALDDMAETSLRVLEQSPADPIWNHVYRTALGAREMTLNKLGTALPVGARLTRF